MKKEIVLFLMLVFLANIYAQQTQVVRGTVIDKETAMPMPGVSVKVITDTINKLTTVTDANGRFRLEKVPLGKQTLRFAFTGYENKISDIIVMSAKEVILTIELEESTQQLEDVVVTAIQRGELNNDMATVSARTFSVEETERYAGSRGDPARMASNFAGVQGADDSRNDIVVRGNSPLAVVYRLEGIDIPNPNHFAVAGSAGGPVSILNNKVMGNSDFFTGAFPAEYGNSISAVFDIKLRNGNNEKHEFTGQFGFLGTELTAEGPINKQKHSSYLGVYRYSTLSIFKTLGISLGTDAVPQYQDLTFKMNFPGKKNSNLSVFGISGMSGIAIKISEQIKPATDFYGDDDRDQYFNTRMAVVGVGYSKILNEKSLLKITVATSHEQQKSLHNFVARHLAPDTTWVIDSIYQLQAYRFIINKIPLAFNINTKINKHHVIKYGFTAEMISFNFIDSALNYTHTAFRLRWDYQGTGALIQPYVQWKYKPNDTWTFNTGLHAQYFSVSNSISVFEPRAGIKYALNNKQSLNFGAGIHSQTQPYYTYFYHLTDTAGRKIYHNRNMDFTKSAHVVLGYDRAFNATTRMKLETYYQSLYNIPVTIKPSAFSMTNMGSGFARFFPDSLKNTGSGTNYGIELTLEKFFNKSFFFLFTASLYDAKYKGSDGIERNTDYNGNYILNFLSGKEFKIKEKNILAFGIKITTAGGRRYGYVDTAASNFQRELVWLDEGYNTRQFRPYFRLDFKINYKINAKKVSHEIALDLVNLLNTKNILTLSYSPNPFGTGDNFRENYQLGFLPLFYYRLDF